MKKSLILLALGASVSFASAQKLQNSEVPTSVKSAFQKLHPKATDVRWEKEKENYEASFDVNKVDNSVLFDAHGNLIETEVEIELSQLPRGILEYVKTHYADKTVKEAAKITNTKGDVTYEAEIKGMDLIFNSTGKFIKEIKE